MAGKRGAPLGNKNGSNGKPWTHALERALAQYTAKGLKAGEAIRRIADGVVERAVAGDYVAIKELSERLDGKAVQPLAGNIDTTVTVEVIRFGDRSAS
jgi:hypothetical protein